MKAAVDFFGFHNNAERICKKLLERFAMLVELRRNEPDNKSAVFTDGFHALFRDQL